MKAPYPTAPGFVWVPSRPEEIAAMAADVARLREGITAEDWENACHALVWAKDPAAFDAIRAQAERERAIRMGQAHPR